MENPEGTAGADQRSGPRVQLEYERELHGVRRRVQVPFVMGVLADLTGDASVPPLSARERRFIEVDRDNFDACVRVLKPRVKFTVPSALAGEGELAVDVTFECIDDFRPGAVARNVVGVRQWLSDRERLVNLVAYVDGKPAAEAMLQEMFQDRTLLEALASRSVVRRAVETFASATFYASNPSETRREAPFLTSLGQALGAIVAAAELEWTVETLAYWAMRRGGHTMSDWRSMAEALLVFIDARLSSQLSLIIQHAKFQQLEGAWRGLHYLVSHTASDELLAIRVFNISKPLLAKTMRKFAGEAWDQSPLMHELYDRVYGNPGGAPYGCLVGDYHFDHSPGDVELLSALARVAAACHAPLIAGAAPSLFGAESWPAAVSMGDPAALLNSGEHAGWNALRESGDAKYIGLAMPRVLARRPYGSKRLPVQEFEFEEDLAGGALERFTWMNAAYAMAVNINRAFKRHGWCVAIRGAESGGTVEGLPVHSFPTDNGDVHSMIPTELVIDDRREAALSHCGLMPLVHRRGANVTFFLGAQSLQKPAETSDFEAAAAARLTARLPCVLAVSRVVHYLKCIARDQSAGVRNFASAQACEGLLGEWLRGYVIENPSGVGDEALVRAPLWGAQLSVEDVAGSPGVYDVQLRLRIGYEIESFNWFSATFRL